MPEQSFETERLQSRGIYGCVDGKFIQEDPDIQQYVAMKERDLEAGFKTQLEIELGTEKSERQQLRKAEQQKTEALAKGFTPDDPEVYTLQAKINGLKESQKMSVHVRENIESMIKHHSTLASNAEAKLQHIQAVKSRSEKR